MILPQYLLYIILLISLLLDCANILTKFSVIQTLEELLIESDSIRSSRCFDFWIPGFKQMQIISSDGFTWIYVSGQ